MTILSIETSCDETSVAIIEGQRDKVYLRSNIIATSLTEHAKTGGIIPEVASRAQLRYILPVLTNALKKVYPNYKLNLAPPPIDAIAVTYGPGLIGPLLIGVETAKTLSFVWSKPLFPVNHMLGHIYANFINHEDSSYVPEFPLLALVVSGGHTDLLYLKKHGSYEVLGGTRDDAAGEAFDKIGRLLGLSYPAGPIIEKLAKKGNPKRFNFPRPLLKEPNFEFSFSGLKTAVLREVKTHKTLDDQTVNDIAAATQAAISDVLVKKTLCAAAKLSVKSILLSGGVSANQMLRETFQSEIDKQKLSSKLFFPPKFLCTDNAAMIGSAAYFIQNPKNWQQIEAEPELYY